MIENVSFTWPIQAAFQATVSSPGEQIRLSIEGTNEEVLKKIIGCFVITMLPEKGLEEALTSLKDIFEFYSYTPTKALAQEGTAARMTARVGEIKKRPDLLITE